MITSLIILLPVLVGLASVASVAGTDTGAF